MTAVDRVLAGLNAHPVLMEVGAAVRPAEVWDAVARQSIYVAVGPDTTTLSPALHDNFFRISLVEDVVTPEPCRVATFYETCDRAYSTVLKPHAPETTALLDGQCWSEHERLANATTITSLLDRLSLDRLDWLHTNVNGVDLRLFRSITPSIRRRILALDTVFDLVHLWGEPGSPVTAYQDLTAEGFWLTRLSSHGFVRIQPKSVQQLEALAPGLSRVHLGDRLRAAPGWMFARFLRTLDSLLSVSSSPVDYATLWAFAMVDDQLGYAADVAFQYRRIFGEDEACKTMVEETVSRIRSRVERRPTALPHVSAWTGQPMAGKLPGLDKLKPILRRLGTIWSF